MGANVLPAFAVCTAMPAVGAALAGEQLNKHLDANGNVTYSDIPVTPGEKQLEIANTARNGGAEPAQKAQPDSTQ